MSSDTACGTRSEQFKEPLRVVLHGPSASNYITTSPVFCFPSSPQASFIFRSSQLSQSILSSKLACSSSRRQHISLHTHPRLLLSPTPSSSETMSGSKAAAPPAQDTRIKSILEQGAVKFVIKTKDQKWHCTLLDRATHEKKKASKGGSSSASISGSESGSSASGSAH
ncbi:hypothetical protein QBC32DRAFT_372368 [Pseudoneurospora amorphoporcata]|uniref:Uncharacterized protein n=1 Tax=Pseudoneurospora amorphoporcata TaxID=241081 RepID=A0AAN6NTL2_9PEZI|nr:hypothetical protein QBC32DRAFT_372368 [Pseudoneurospora amorphoporcata]